VAYPFVPARYDYGPRPGPALAFVVHMAEGGGTVGYLAGPNVQRGVSVHYVIEYTGRIVQMLPEDHASGSINPTTLRTTDDPNGLYGVTAAKACLGAMWSNPNLAVISLEIEGFAVHGPNGAELDALDRLVADVRSRHPAIGLLGHRDFTDSKACPGQHIPWQQLGGHGPAGGDVPGLDLTYPPGPIATGSLVIPKGTDAIRTSTGIHYRTTSDATRPAAVKQIAPAGSSGYDVDLVGDATSDVSHFIRASEPGLAFVPDPPPASCDPAVNAALDQVQSAIAAARP
jgi:hypothetical protein